MSRKSEKPDTGIGNVSARRPTKIGRLRPSDAPPLPERLYIIHHRANPHREEYEEELETALESRCSVLIIEPEALGDEVSRWISVGNFVHKTAVLSGAAAFVLSLGFPAQVRVAAPVVLASALATALYNVSWQFDPASKFQPFSPSRHGAKLPQLPLHLLQSPNPVVLVRRNDYARKILHTSVTVVVSGLWLWNVCRKYLSGTSS